MTSWTTSADGSASSKVRKGSPSSWWSGWIRPPEAERRSDVDDRDPLPSEVGAVSEGDTASNEPREIPGGERAVPLGVLAWWKVRHPPFHAGPVTGVVGACVQDSAGSTGLRTSIMIDARSCAGKVVDWIPARSANSFN